jgi:autotransporter passenger strand-loop-strand repeat protein
MLQVSPAGGGGLSVAASLASGATETVGPSGTASGTKVGGGALLTVQGGTTVGAVVSSGGTEKLLTGGVASGTTVLSGGKLTFAGGKVSGVTISSGGGANVASGTSVSGLTIGNGATLTVVSGAQATGTVLSGGTEVVADGGIIGGAVMFGPNSTLSVAGTSGIAFKTSGFAETDTIKLSSFGFSAAEKLTFVQNTKTQGTLTIVDGSLKATITLMGQYVATGFQLAASGGGTAITYTSATASSESPLLATHSG